MTAPINILFVCGRNNRRSPTAERIFKHDHRMRLRAAGLGDTSPRRVKEADLKWADLVLVFERKYAARIRANFRGVDPMPPIADLDISDEYIFMQPELVELMKANVTAAIEAYRVERDSPLLE